MSQLTWLLIERFGLKCVMWVVVSYAKMMVAPLAVFASEVDWLDVFTTLLFVGYGLLCLVIQTT